MPVYIVFIRVKTFDFSQMVAYWPKAPPTLHSRLIKVLASNGRHRTLEGPDVKGVVVAEFPSLEVARVWYENPAQQAAAQHQFDSWLADMEYCDRF